MGSYSSLKYNQESNVIKDFSPNKSWYSSTYELCNIIYFNIQSMKIIQFSLIPRMTAECWVQTHILLLFTPSYHVKIICIIHCQLTFKLSMILYILCTTHSIFLQASESSSFFISSSNSSGLLRSIANFCGLVTGTAFRDLENIWGIFF